MIVIIVASKDHSYDEWVYGFIKGPILDKILDYLSKILD